tara:strand:+ start:2275 stop:2856 length:582 start_codon:yes stop_codon:yes gene_type:complete
MSDKKESNKQYYEQNKEKWVDYRKKQKGNQKEWYQKNKDRLVEKQRKYREEKSKDIEWVEKEKEYKKTYATQKKFKVSAWKKNGLIGDYDTIWERYCNTSHCDLCNVELTMESKMTTTRKSMEHCHKTGQFRNITCHKCNMGRKCDDDSAYTNNTTGHKGIYLVNDEGRIRYRHKTRRFQTLAEAVQYKEEQL